MNNFNKDKKYISLCDIFSPNGIIKKDTVLNGEEWKHVLIFDVGNSFLQMFKIV